MNIGHARRRPQSPPATSASTSSSTELGSNADQLGVEWEAAPAPTGPAAKRVRADIIPVQKLAHEVYRTVIGRLELGADRTE